MIAPFKIRYRRALADPRLRSNLLAFQRAWHLTRDAAFARLTEEGPGLGATAPSFGASKARLESIEAELASLAEERDGMVAHWQAEKDAIGAVREIKERLEQAHHEVERAERDADLQRAADRAKAVSSTLRRAGPSEPFVS
jgi:alpha-beta hydrolase superfamily lysophospholipase